MRTHCLLGKMQPEFIISTHNSITPRLKNGHPHMTGSLDLESPLMRILDLVNMMMLEELANKLMFVRNSIVPKHPHLVLAVEQNGLRDSKLQDLELIDPQVISVMLILVKSVIATKPWSLINLKCHRLKQFLSIKE